MIDKIKRFIDYAKLLQKYNTIKMEHEVLKEQIKDKCFNKVLEAINDPIKNDILKKENKRLRLENKRLRDEKKGLK